MSKSLMKLSVCLYLGFFSTSSFAASFDCKKAASLVEKAICSNPTLSKLDDSLAKAYKQALNKASDQASLQAEQRAWLSKVRNPCRNEHCIQEAYQVRLAELDGNVNPAEIAGFVGEYQRFFKGKPDEHTATLSIKSIINNKVSIKGDSIWVGNLETGNVNLGTIEGEFPISQRTLYYHDEYACKFTVIFKSNGLEVKNDNGQCGGLNVSFNGSYRKVK